MSKNRLSVPRLFIVGVTLLVLVASIYLLSRPPTSITPTDSTPPNGESPTTKLTIAFNFDTGSPLLVEMQNTPFNQTSSGVTVRFSSPSDNVTPAFSVQSYDTTFLKLSQFSGKWLYDNKPSRDALDIKFSQPVTSINFTFATIEYHGGPGIEPSNITLTAYLNSINSVPIGRASVRGTFSNELFPQGVLSFNSSSQPFNLVRIEIPYQGPKAATDFFVDNIIVTTAN